MDFKHLLKNKPKLKYSNEQNFETNNFLFKISITAIGVQIIQRG